MDRLRFVDFSFVNTMGDDCKQHVPSVTLLLQQLTADNADGHAWLTTAVEEAVFCIWNQNISQRDVWGRSECGNIISNAEQCSMGLSCLDSEIWPWDIQRTDGRMDWRRQTLHIWPLTDCNIVPEKNGIKVYIYVYTHCNMVILKPTCSSGQRH